MIFLLAVFGGGWAFGELMVIAGYERLPYYDLPYVMLALMIFEAPLDLPREWYLIAFWYALPVIAVYVIGQGAADFVRLFFNRSERRDAWEEALASTYRNHVIVMGMGHVGLRVAHSLVNLGFEVVTIEVNLQSDIDAELSQLGAPCIIGDGRQSQILEKAGIRYARAFVACTSNDHVNLEAVMRVRDMSPDIRIVARMWDDQFAKQMKRFMGVDAVISSSELAAPAFAGLAVGVEITQTLEINEVEYSMIRLTVVPQAFLDGQTVGDLQSKHDMDIVLHGHPHGDVEVHPAGDVMVRSGDILVIFARHDRITEIVNRNRKASKRVSS